MFIAVDDTYGPERDTGSAYVTGDRRTHVAVVFRDTAVPEIRQQMNNCKEYAANLLDCEISEFHFTDIYNRGGPWAKAKNGENLAFIAGFASIYRQYHWPVFVQTIDDRTIADLRRVGHPLLKIRGHIDGLDPADRSDLSLLLLLFRLKFQETRVRVVQARPSGRMSMAEGLKALLCPSCNGSMTKALSDAVPLKASSFGTCLRRCNVCEIGASNTDSGNVTYIHRDPLTNIPKEARAGALDTLRAALNIRNRLKKESYFGFSTSEDAVTWVVFDYLRLVGLLIPALHQLGLPLFEPQGSEPTVLLWGVPIGASDRAAALRDRLISECIALGERPNSLSEPDVLIDLGDQGIVLIEVKYFSGNDNQPSIYANWSKYESRGRLGWRFDDVKATGCYELARYWCLLSSLAEGRRGWLVNLGLPALFAGPEGDRLDRFVAALGPSESLEFRTATWADLLTSVLSEAESWFARFCLVERKLGLTERL